MFTERSGRRLPSATGHLTIAAGWLSHDSGRPADARSLYNEALAATRIAYDPGFEGHAFGCVSLLAEASGRPREVISAAQGAQTAVKSYGSARMLSLSAMREPGGWALLGDASATDQAIVRAHRLYAKGPSDADPDWLEFYRPPNWPGSKPSRGQTSTSTRGPRPGLSRLSCGTAISSQAIGPRTRPTWPSNVR